MNEQERKAKAKSVFWWTYCITIFSVIIFSTFLANWLHMKSLSSAFGIPSMLAGAYLGVFVCRKRGLSLEEQIVNPLARIRTKEDLSKEEKYEIEVRSITPDKTITLLGVAVSALVTATAAVCLVMSPPRHLNDIFPALLMLLLLISCAWLASYLFGTRDKGRFIVASNVQQLSTSVLGFKNLVPWERINSCQVIAAKGVWGQETSRVLFFDANEKLLTTVWLASMTHKDKAIFLDYIDQRFALEPNRVLD